ncbi:glycosyltransferase family 29 protein [Streptomyces sp. SPB074]|uniref:glycosyltransferase family 29 protein n=1 Tax=Streptomyces sp. (strain SPB074) TaxID=465543 RepID=UPI00017F142F|nr:glycosyltransferase family 29 protein [Streptomyces sp. SPB074]
MGLHDLDSRVTAPGPDTAAPGDEADDPRTALNTLLAHYADLARSRRRGPVADPVFGDTTWISLGEFRNRIAGRSVCLVANSGQVGSGSLGAEIDAYDLVVRFNSYRIDPAATGARTDIHVTIHKHALNWDQRVDTRLVFGGDVGAWRSSLRNRLVPGAQKHLGDDSLRWPLREVGKVGPQEWPAIPTTGFNTLFLLDFLDVNPVIDLIGFDFYESGAYRTSEAMRMPVTSVHEYADEKTWVLDRATKVTGHKISLR